jgi:hypothetical protein
MVPSIYQMSNSTMRNSPVKSSDPHSSLWGENCLVDHRHRLARCSSPYLLLCGALITPNTLPPNPAIALRLQSTRPASPRCSL